MVLLAALVVAATVAAPATPTLPNTYVDRAARISIRYPHGWRVSREPFTAVTDPVERLVLYAPAPLPPTRRAPRRDQVIALLLETVPPLPLDLRQFPRRPRRFRLPHPGRMEGFDGDRWAELVFRDHGRAFYVFVGVGTAATGKEASLLAALDSLVVAAR
jgi:hypothetical protein